MILCVLALGRAIDFERAALVDKFELRTGVAANFIGVYLDNQQELGRARAEDLLSAPDVTPAQLQVVVSGLGYAAGGVFDGGGRLIVGLPYDPARVGLDFTATLEHVRVAVAENRPASSQVVVSPALDTPAVGIAVPYSAPDGNRIFTGVFAVQGGTLSALTRQSVGLETSGIHLLDRENNVIASSERLSPAITPLAQLDPVLAHSVSRRATGTYEDDTSYVFASNPVPGTDWRIVTAVPTDVLFQPSRSAERAAMAVLFTLATAGLVGATLLGMAMRRRRKAEDETTKLNAELEARVAARTEQLATANHELETFSYSVSHDLRAPLRAIQGFSAILLEEHGEKLDAEGARLLGVVSRNTAKMSQLIDDILAFSRIGRRDLGHSAVDMGALVNDVVTELREAEPGRDVSVTVARLEPAHGDRALVRQVWANLLGNAFKFTASVPAAEVHVDSVRAGDEIVYRVRDNGAGFDPAYEDKLFGVFQRLHGPEFPGTGIGLAIVKRIVTRHGGRVWAEGAARQRSVVLLHPGAVLPLETRGANDMNDTVPVERTEPVEILPVEDDPDDAELTLRGLRGVANSIVWVKDGAEALDFLFARGEYAARQSADQPRLVLLDLKLPKVDGLAVLRQVRANPATRLVPIVALTSSAEERDIIDTYSNGINSYITKPVSFADLQKAVESLGMYWLLMNRVPITVWAH